MNHILIKAFKGTDGSYMVDIETYVTVFVFTLSKSDKVLLKVKIEGSTSQFIKIDLNGVKHEIVEEYADIASYCTWPVIVSDNKVISGLCSAARFIIKLSSEKSIRELLGFREACLMSCSESSVWTRFCEIDIIRSMIDLSENQFNYYKDTTFIIPVNICRFAFHMKQPIRIHNMYKLARIKNNDPSIKSSTPVEKLNISHLYGEGPFMTLSDAILYPCFNVFFQTVPITLLTREIPEVCKWFDRMSQGDLPKIPISVYNLQNYKIDKFILPDFQQHSLYTSDPNRYKPEKRIFTKQDDIDNSIKMIGSFKNRVLNETIPYGAEVHFNWDDVPLDANPLGGALPEKRADRKSEQLMNLAKAVMKLAGSDKLKIVDFCSGSGHLGILLAYLLPHSTIILVENKERSLERAIQRINSLKLANIQIVQSNLDYFIGKFDIGVALHACGVATDLVIQKCINHKAHFVVCPCCYGGIKDCHHLTYPRSDNFKSLDWKPKDFLTLGHAADQTHDVENEKTKQGYLCMDIVDTDRKWYAESCGYSVHLGKLQPVTCTNKNNLLVGVFTQN